MSTYSVIMGPLLVEMLKDKIEVNIHKQSLNNNLVYLYKYVHDIIAYFNGTNRQDQDNFRKLCYFYNLL